ncbi:MAG: nuclear transport factor 2 family protein [Acidobacteriota bacterium]
MTKIEQALANWHECVKTRNMNALGELLADEARFHSPFLWKPKEGKTLTASYLTAASMVLEDFHYHREMTDGTSWTLEFSARVGEFSLKGVDLIRFNEDGKIVEFEVMIRPFKGLTALAEAMQKQLAAQDTSEA